MICDGCSGSGACDPCDGYGTLPDSYPNAHDGTDCEICTGDGVCADCGGTRETPDPHDIEHHESSAMTLWKASA